MSRYYTSSSALPRLPSFPRSHAAVLEPVMSLDPSDHAAAAAKLQREQQQQREHETSDGSSAAADDEGEFGPEQESKFNEEELLHTKTPLLTGDDVNEKREEIREYFHKTFSLYESLFDVLAGESTYHLQPEKLRHPLIFYFGHTAVFFINKLRLAGLLTGRINESIESTLAIGVDEMSWDDLNVGNYVWPSVQQVRAYRDMARVTVDDLISSLPLTLPITWESPFWVILMGCEHERIHLETSSVLFRQLPIEEVKAVPMWDHCKQFRLNKEDVPANALIAVPAGTVVAGNSKKDHKTYGWDLEYGHFQSEVATFEAAQYLTSNAEFYEFVLDGAYQDQSLWGEEGWKFVQFRSATCPVFWVPIVEEAANAAGGAADAGVPPSAANDAAGAAPSEVPFRPRYRYRTMTAIIDMPWDWPCDLNYIECKAFCEWKNRQRAKAGANLDGRVYRLPTEAEYLRLREHAYPAQVVDATTGEVRLNDQPFWAVAPGNINLEHGASSCPIDQHRFDHGFCDIIGNVWQWTETPIMPFRGFQFHPMYDDFSVPTFDRRHNVFCGGSWASTGNEATRMARFAFRRHFYQHSGLRYILADPLNEKSNPTQAMCETDVAVTGMMDAQFNDAAHAKLAAAMRMMPMPNYALRIAEIAMQVYKAHGNMQHQQQAAAAADASTDPSAPALSTLTSAGPRAIDIGCACGRSTFELAKLAAAPSAAHAPIFNHILGLDFSTRFIRIAAQLQYEGHAEYAMRKEGELISYHSIESVADAPSVLAAAAASSAVPSAGELDVSVSAAPSVLDLDLARIGMQDRVEFMQGDACNLSAKYTGYDLVLASNLLEYLYAPRVFLESIGARMKAGGILLLASSYSWDEAFTPKSHWLGGVKDLGGESVETARAVSEILQAEFEPLPAFTQELPVLRKFDQRNYSLKFAQITAWKKR